MARRAQAQLIQEEAVDENQDLDQHSKSGLVEDEIEVSRKVAKRLGWTPKEEWTRDPDKWVDAPDFLDRTPREMETLKERLKRTGQATDAALEEARRQARTEAQAEVRAAAEAQDPEAAEKAAAKLAQNSGPDPRTLAWVARNNWFEADPIARAAAAAEVQRLAERGMSIEDQLDGAEREVRKRFPEHFGRVEERAEVRLSESNRQPPNVTGGSRGGSGPAKEKGFGDIPRQDRELFESKLAKIYRNKGMSPDEGRARYAKAYWANKDE